MEQRGLAHPSQISLVNMSEEPSHRIIYVGVEPAAKCQTVPKRRMRSRPGRFARHRRAHVIERADRCFQSAGSITGTIIPPCSPGFELDTFGTAQQNAPTDGGRLLETNPKKCGKVLDTLLVRSSPGATELYRGACHIRAEHAATHPITGF